MRSYIYHFAKKLIVPNAPKPEVEWARIMQGQISIGAETRLDQGKLIAKESLQCMLTIGSNSNIECLIIFERKSVNVNIGSRTHIGGRTMIDAACGIEIGDDVLIAFDVMIVDHNSHSTSFNERKNDVQDWMSGNKNWTKVHMSPVKICNKAWIGAKSIIMKGVTIGEGAVVGAGSVVREDVPPWSIAAGNPAKIIRHLTEEERVIS